MRPRRTPDSNVVYRLPGGTEDNDLWCERLPSAYAGTRIMSEWELDDDEREAIAAGGRVYLVQYGEPIQPVSLGVVVRDAAGAPTYVGVDDP